MQWLVRAGIILTAPGSLAAQGGVAAGAPPDTVTRVARGAFVDGYYAFDFNRPRDLDRAYTTQPARHNEFNANLAFVEATLSGSRVRGRLALQAGTSVQANYAGEPTTGAVSGATLGGAAKRAASPISRPSTRLDRSTPPAAVRSSA
jgi:hypothetical protein